MIRTLRNKKGLTLIELIAVLVILGIIAAIAIPTIGNTIDNARENAATSEWANVESAALLYIAQNSTETAFSITDLITANRLSADPELQDDALNVEDSSIAPTADVFTVVSGNLVISSTYPAIWIDGFLVYGTAPS